MQKHIFNGSETIQKKYQVVSKIWSKTKKWTDHPSHPIPSHPIPSIRQNKPLTRLVVKSYRGTPEVHMACGVPIFRSNWEGGNFSTKIRWIGKFSEVEKFPINRKIFHFISGPLSLPIFRSNWTGNFPNKIRWIRKFSEVDKFPINRKIFHLTNFKKMVAKNGGEQKAAGNKKKGEKNRKNRWKKLCEILKKSFFF